MKKFWKTMMFAMLGVFSMSSCEDVPAPYNIPSGGEDSGSSTTELASIDFTQGIGSWTTEDKTSLTGVWYNNAQYGMVGSGYKSSKANAAESWLISPEIDMTEAKDVTMILNEAVNKIDAGSVVEQLTVWVSTDEGQNWTEIKSTSRPAGTSWTFQDDTFDLTAYDGLKIRVAFKYVSTTESAPSWEIKTIKFKGEGSITIEGQSMPDGEKRVPTGSGTAEDPYNVAAVDSFTNAGNYSNNNPSPEVYVKGVVSQIGDLNEKYGELNYYISDDGTTTNQFYVYNGYGLGGEKITSADYLKVGDEVIICGKTVTYSGTNEFTFGSKIVELNGKKSEDTPAPDPQPSGDNILPNGDFESWTSGLPDHWKSASTASNASLSQSTEAHGGSYAVAIAGDASANKRMAYEEITLKPGTYTYSFYAKSTTDNASQCRIGYTTVTDGKANSNYTYGDYTTLNNSTWSQASFTFTLSAETTLCLVVMNPKTSNYATAQTILVDDATLTTSDGGLADGSDDNGDDNNDDKSEVKHITIAEFLANADTNTTYELTGTVANIKNTTYGNFDLVEGDAQIYVYGLLDFDGNKKNFASLGINEGSVITITGKYTLYNNSPEIVDAQIIKVGE